MEPKEKKRVPLGGYQHTNAELRGKHKLLLEFTPNITNEACLIENLHYLLTACIENNLQEVKNVMRGKPTLKQKVRRVRKFFLAKARADSFEQINEVKDNNQDNLSIIKENDLGIKETIIDGKQNDDTITNNNDIQKIEEEIENNNLEIDLESMTIDCWTAIHVACFYGAIEVVELLINLNVNLNARTIQSWTPLYIASMKNNIKIIELLMGTQKINYCQQFDIDHCTPLHIAALFHHKETLEKLLHYEGVSNQDEDSQKRIPLYYAYSSAQTALLPTTILSLLPQNSTRLNFSGCGMYSLPNDDILQTLVSIEVKLIIIF